ncbi:MAG: DNA protecting protein DprA [Candidatus Taylorbacteria bacterium RIFCSPHIGHO2_01_FULL_46_22b]|uniref:DNA protecting protein DprA n=1 Tax=Candidatus Taylorbacteria bacterium RIFCSPHIGHO2_01_FULL_46_22b TaxID=1802301 RepID=A0A1G2M1V9_9BACT|nr:MAG: DNA protecting protein DprA [Candidatus Taylorbacteria bacterium RIFCSPHIGHO2_01_FULL_46_22b]
MESIEKLLEKSFPPLLSEIPDPPKQLYYRGTLPDWEQHKFLCVVGSRKYSNYGREVCEQLIAGLSGFPIIIVSGLALGIDSIAHKAAIASGLKTIAVPGSGLDWNVLYPASHAHLAKQIIEKGGALMSEFEPKFRATPYSFPQRNRIMAGMSHAVLVIEAEQKSGTLITSRLATEYNREVLAVPGSIFSTGSSGPHMLIRLGATPVTNSRDILTALGFETLSDQLQTTRDYSDCSSTEKSLLALLSQPLSRDELIRQSKLSTSEANTTLSILEIKGLVKEVLGEIRRT